jgi:para-aminobenzoate synthetase / 4-amino-4-deoxychorismate lyase
VGLAGILAALFPCGSVTGAPKISTMGLIAQLEESPREVYCGAIGVVRPGGDATFSVPIRTLCLDRQSEGGEYGTGGGIVWDSTADSEYDELLAKAVVVREPWPDFELVETMAAQDGTIARLELHLQRLAGSADYFGFAYPERRIRRALTATARGRPPEPETARRIRLTLAADGVFSIQEEPLGRLGTDSPERGPGAGSPLPAAGPGAAGPVPVALADAPVRSSDRFLFHKTTHRDAYDAFRSQGEGMFDVLLWNERGEVTEFTRGNVVVEMDGHLTTPPLSAGLLPGCYRRQLLEAGTVVEAALRVRDLPRAARIWFINSARRWIEVYLAQRRGPAPDARPPTAGRR